MKSDGVPFVYFDWVSALGTMNGSIQIELVGRVLTADGNGTTTISFVDVAHLRCSPVAAIELARSLNAAVAMLDSPSGPQPGANSMN